MKKRKSRIYWKRGRAYGDFRDLGGRLEALIPPGESRATTDADIAGKLAAARVRELEEKRRRKHLLGTEREATLAEFAERHLREKARAGKVTDGWLALTEERLQHAVDFLGAERNLLDIGTRDVQEWANEIARRPGRRGKSVSPQTVRHFLNALFNLYKRAQSEGVVPPGFNPVASMLEKPTPKREEAHFLTVPEVALLIESARTYRPKRGDVALPHGYEMLALLFLTGCRWAELAGLLTDDISFDRGTVTVRLNEFRRLKTVGSRRVIPLWPQAREILQSYLFGGSGPPPRLLFPASRVAIEQPVTDLRGYLDKVAMRAGWKEGEIRSRIARHSYCAARLQTTEGGAPVSPYTVAREMGWRSLDMIWQVYGRLGEIRHRSEVVEYRIEQHRGELGERLRALERAM